MSNVSSTAIRAAIARTESKLRRQQEAVAASTAEIAMYNEALKGAINRENAEAKK